MGRCGSGKDKSAHNKWLVGVGVAVIIAATVWAYVPAIRGGFIWNDDTYVSKNAVLTRAGGFWQIWSLRWKSKPTGQEYLTGYTEQYYPLVFSSFWLESCLWGNSNPMGFHVVNVLLHIANALLIWLICRRLGFSWGLLAGAVFALHPVEVESVAWITERKNVLSGLFYLLAVLSYLRFDKSGRKLFYLGAFGCFVLALLSKTVTCTLPMVLLLLLWLRHGRIGGRDLLRMVPFIIVGASLGLFTAYYERNSVGAAGLEWDLEFWQRLVIAGKDVFFYSWKLLWPTNLIFIYPRWNPEHFSRWDLLWPMGVIAVGVGLWYGRKAISRAPLVAWCGFVVSLFPALGFVDVYPFRFSFVADHFQYLGSAFFIALVVGVGYGLYKRIGRAEVGIGLAVVVLLLLGWLSRSQAGIYKDLRSLWEDTVDKNPEAWIGWNNLGAVYGRLGEEARAIKAYEQAIRVNPDAAKAQRNLGIRYGKAGRSGEAIAAFKRAIEIEPGYLAAYHDLGNAYNEAGRHSEAIMAYKQAIARKPDDAVGYSNLGVVYGRMGRYEEAIRAFRRAIEKKKDYAEAYYNLGTLYSKQGKHGEAVEAFEEAIRIRPNSGEAHYNLGISYGQLEKYAEAIASFKEAIRVMPDYAPAHVHLVIGYLTVGEKSLALEELEVLRGIDKVLAEKLSAQIDK